MRSLSTSRVAIALAAAAATVAVSGLLPSGSATARPIHEDTVEQLRLENRQLREDIRYFQAASDELMNGLDRIDSAARRLRDRKAQRSIRNLVADTRDAAGRYVSDSYDSYGDRYDTGYDYGYNYGGIYNTVSDDAVLSLAAHVTKATYADDQLAVVKTASASSSFTVDQILTLMKAASYEDTRIDIAAALYGQVVDPQNWYLIEDGLTYSSSKTTLRERIGQ